MNLLAILGVGATLWQLVKPKDPVDKITDHAMLLTGEMVAQGVPVAEAAKSAVAQAVDQHFVQTGQLPTTTVSPWAAIPGIDATSVHSTAWNVSGRMPSGKSMFQSLYSEASANDLANQWMSSGVTNVTVTRVD